MQGRYTCPHVYGVIFKGDDKAEPGKLWLSSKYRNQAEIWGMPDWDIKPSRLHELVPGADGARPGYNSHL